MYFKSSGVIVLFFTLMAPAAWAVSSDDKLTFKIEPIVGYERVQSDKVGRSVRNRLTYGARGTFGYSIVSGEVEYLRGQDSRLELNGNSITESDERLRLGVRSSYSLGSLLLVTGRGGLEARQHKTEVTPNGGATTRTIDPIAYNPYAGAELGFRLGDQATLSAGLTVVFKDWPDMSKNDYQTTLAIGVKIGTSSKF